MTSFRYWAGALIPLGVALLCGCGVINSGSTDVALEVGHKHFTIDASSWQVNQAAATSFLAMSCEATPTVCGAAAMQACAANCTGSCDSTTHTCDLGLRIGVYSPVDLQMDAPELTTLSNAAVIKVTIDSVQYAVTPNTLDVDTPPLQVYVAPTSITDPEDPAVQQIGTIRPVAAMTTVGATDMEFTPTGEQALVDIMTTYRTPFNVIVGSTLSVSQDSQVPSGSLEADVTIFAHAGP
jgi:hypothetical protein